MTDNFDIIKDFLTPKEIIVEEVNPNHSKIILALRERIWPYSWKRFKKNYLIFYTWFMCCRSEN